MKRIYYYLKERRIYNTFVKHLGVTFEEYYSYAKNIQESGFNPSQTVLLGKKILKISNFQYLQCIMEIFVDEVYKFETTTPEPFIIDCGANMGLSTIYFKSIYPNAQVISFEADSQIMKLCKNNIEKFELKNVELVEAAVWTEDGHMKFLPNDTLGGKLEEGQDSEETIDVKTVRLKSYLNRKVDFLKMDIEGAEVAVLLDVKDQLSNVESLFVEYHSPRNQPEKLDLLLKVLKDAGFRFYIKEAAPLMNKPFIDYKKSKFKDIPFDMQLNIFAYRLP